MSKVSPADGEVDVQLLKDEGGGLMREEGIATITFYKGDFKAAVEALRAQYALVVAANPWLAGCLVKTKGGVCLRHPMKPSATEIDALFTATSTEDTDAFKIAPNETYTKICKDMYASKKVIIGSGSSLLGKNKPVTNLTLSESAPGEFALIFSLSHAVGDGRTYYEIFKMLQPGAACVRELASTRVQAFSEEMRDMCGRKELAWADSISAACMFTCSMMCGGNKVKCVAYHLDEKKLADAKAEAAKDGEVPYVSTNDILTSGFFNACNTRIGMMGMDCREKLDGIGKDLAGNYVTALTMDPDTFATPATVRKMLSTKPYVTTGRPLPGCCKWACGRESAKFAMVTNWSSFAGDMVQLQDCEMVIHLPVQNPAYCVYDLMIPFSSGVGKVGVICWTVSTDEAGLCYALPVGECVSTELFPPS